MTDEILQNDADDVENILNAPDDDDIMKDFNFDDILENPGSETVSSEISIEPEGNIIQDNIMSEINNNFEKTEAVDNTISEPEVVDLGWDMPTENNVQGDIVQQQDEQNAEVVTDDDVGQSGSSVWENEAIPSGEEEYVDDVVHPTEVSSSSFEEEEYVDDVGQPTEISPLNGVVETPHLNFLRKYDGQMSDNMYNITKGFESGDFKGDENCDAIHVNVGYDTYGWNVEFANGVTMSLRDVREYQKKQGCLPFNSGTITYGKSSLRFRDIKRIVVYETVKYFSYGA